MTLQKLTLYIEVYISLLVQLILALGIFVALGTFKMKLETEDKKNENRFLALATAMVEFHKHQCYYISAIEIAVIVLLKGSVTPWGQLDSKEPGPQYYLTLSIALAMSGFVPIVFTVMSIALYGRLSWHILALSTVSVALSSANLITAWESWKIYGIEDGPPDLPLVALCGSLASNLKGYTPRPFDFRIVATIYSLCLTLLLACIAKHAHSNLLSESQRDHILKIWGKLSTMSVHNESRTQKYGRATLIVFGAVIWLACFGYHFYLYGIFYRNNLVTTNWAFGQIIAVSVWANSIIEFIYLNYSMCCERISS